MNYLSNKNDWYKLRKLGKYNYSITIPKEVIDDLGGYESYEKLYISVEDSNIILSNKTEEERLNTSTCYKFKDWDVYLSPLLSFATNKDIIIGYDLTKKIYFYILSGHTFYDTQRKCMDAVKQHFNYEVPVDVMNKIDKYICNFQLK